MANNTTINSGSGGDSIRDIDRNGVKTQVVQIDVGGSSAESLLVATAKGTQGTVAIPTQDLKDSGRNLFTYYMPIATQAPATTDSIPAAAYYRSGAVSALSAGTAPPIITSGKILRITSITLTYIPQGTAGAVRFSLRYNSAGQATSSSTIVSSWIVPGTVATAGLGVNILSVGVPDGFEFNGGGITMTSVAVTTAGAVSGSALGNSSFCITGFEY